MWFFSCICNPFSWIPTPFLWFTLPSPVSFRTSSTFFPPVLYCTMYNYILSALLPSFYSRFSANLVVPSFQLLCLPSRNLCFLSALFSFHPEPEFVNLLRSPGIDSQPGRPVRQTYLTYRPARLHSLAESLPWYRFLGSLNVYNLFSSRFPAFPSFYVCS